MPTFQLLNGVCPLYLEVQCTKYTGYTFEFMHLNVFLSYFLINLYCSNEQQ